MLYNNQKHLKKDLLPAIHNPNNNWLIIIAGGDDGVIKLILDYSPQNLADIIKTHHDDEYVAIIECRSFLKKELNKIQRFIYTYTRHNFEIFIFLVPDKKAPLKEIRFDGLCSSFLTRISILKRFFKKNSSQDISVRCYEIAYLILNSIKPIDGFLVKTLLDFEPIVKDKKETTEFSIIISHYGKYKYLKTCLSYLSPDFANILVGFDLNKSNNHITEFTENYKDIKFFISNKNKNGPYGIRSELINESPSDVCVFQDSDDISCIDRFKTLINNINSEENDFVGSHELRVDEIENCIKIYRYPLSVNSALNNAPYHCLLFPTSAIKKHSYIECGGLSNHIRFGLDTQFLLKSYFSLKIINVDKFLYIRRRREKSLTTHPKTALGTQTRIRYLKLWKNDFTKIKQGLLTIENSSLNTTKKYNIELKRIN
ncbi:glycosyltransferase [Flavobacterium sp. D11R37]|uniref:glycosyltransferase n=1 Tax=Flavobacterium coralii TaxID=2838017 RepID=UPI001CA7336C|nr:glycosyltransferase [Flavobacterium coralii]MBY8961784.1 glycosyltransferase [Flavobacterium coralii]